MKCRNCAATLKFSFLDLGFSPPSNSYLSEGDLNSAEAYYPLRVKVCDKCLLVQTEDYVKSDEFFNPRYAYLSSTSKSWLEHAANYFQKVIQQFDIDVNSFVIEIASNDGYLLRNFVEKKIPCLGIEPATATAELSEQLGVPVIKEFFTSSLASTLAREHKQADLIVGNNVYAHVPDINDFTRGLKALLKPDGVITLEFPHLMNLIDQNQFDTVYHEHYSYLSLFVVKQIFEKVGLKIWDVEELPTHGGSLRIYAGHVTNSRAISKNVMDLLAIEKKKGLQNIDSYGGLQKNANQVKNQLLLFLLAQKNAGKTVVAYGAAAKGNTLLNYAGIKPDLLPYVCDAAASKQGRYMPGSHIPIYPPDVLKTNKPDYILILPWNIAAEIQKELGELVGDGVQFVTAVPNLRVYQN